MMPGGNYGTNMNPGRGWISEADTTGMKALSGPSIRAERYTPLSFGGPTSGWSAGDIGHMDVDGTLHVAEGHTVAELADLFAPSLFRQPMESLPLGVTDWRLAITASIFLSALGATGQDETTRAFWDAVRERLSAPPVPTAE